MGPGDSHVLIVRDALQKVLSRELASSVLFQALEECEEGVPRDAEAVRALVSGPLARILGGKVDPDTYHQVMQHIVQALAAPEPDAEIDIDIDIPIDTPGPGRGSWGPRGLDDGGFDSEPATALLPVVSDNPVSVVVVSSGDHFAIRLLAALGERIVKAVPVGDVRELRHATFSEAPLIVLVDAADPPSMPDDDLVAGLRALPTQVQVVLWASETPEGGWLSRLLGAADLSTVELRRGEGLEPLLDLILSRRV